MPTHIHLSLVVPRVRGGVVRGGRLVQGTIENSQSIHRENKHYSLKSTYHMV